MIVSFVNLAYVFRFTYSQNTYYVYWIFHWMFHNVIEQAAPHPDRSLLQRTLPAARYIRHGKIWKLFEKWRKRIDYKIQLDKKKVHKKIINRENMQMNESTLLVRGTWNNWMVWRIVLSERGRMEKTEKKVHSARPHYGLLKNSAICQRFFFFLNFILFGNSATRPAELRQQFIKSIKIVIF